MRLLLAASFIFLTAPLMAAETLNPQPPVELTGTQGKFDFIKIDASRNRLLACHTGNGSLDVKSGPRGGSVRRVRQPNRLDVFQMNMSSFRACRARSLPRKL